MNFFFDQCWEHPRYIYKKTDLRENSISVGVWYQDQRTWKAQIHTGRPCDLFKNTTLFSPRHWIEEIMKILSFHAINKIWTSRKTHSTSSQCVKTEDQEFNPNFYPQVIQSLPGQDQILLMLYPYLPDCFESSSRTVAVGLRSTQLDFVLFLISEQGGLLNNS